eukprot:947259-Pelagomonas_calceolata.AAC.1
MSACLIRPHFISFLCVLGGSHDALIKGILQQDGIAKPEVPGHGRWPDAVLKPSYSYIAERGDLCALTESLRHLPSPISTARLHRTSHTPTAPPLCYYCDLLHLLCLAPLVMSELFKPPCDVVPSMRCFAPSLFCSRRDVVPS